MNDTYFHWLIGLIGDSYICKNYQHLLWKLFRTTYIWEIDLDENRAADGVYLRGIFAQSYRCRLDDQYTLLQLGLDITSPCNLLEMMVALARRAEDDIMHDPDFGDRSGEWFWEMIENLGLDLYDDYHWFESEVDRILDVFLHRRYQNNGVGNAFPIRKLNRDLRKTDLWWQMNAYLEERFGL